VHPSAKGIPQVPSTGHPLQPPPYGSRWKLGKAVRPFIAFCLPPDLSLCGMQCTRFALCIVCCLVGFVLRMYGILSRNSSTE